MIPTRYVFALLCCSAMFILYGLRINVSVAIVIMVNHTALSQSHNESMFAECNNINAKSDVCILNKDSDEGEDIEDGPFLWSTDTQGLIKSAYFWGYIVGQLPGGIMAEMISAKWVMFTSIFTNVICTFLSPLAAQTHWTMLVLMRVGQGLGGGVTFPATHVLLSRWAPPAERSMMSSVVYAGIALGTVTFILMTGLVGAKLGWEAIFYIEGVVGTIWFLPWIMFGADSPSKHKFISAEEREMILTSLGESSHAERRKLRIPWKAIFTSRPFLTIMVSQACQNWGFAVLFIELPNYMKMVLKFKIAKNVLLSSLPYFTLWLYSITFAKILDTSLKKGKLSVTNARKIAMINHAGVPALCFFILSLIGTMPTLAVILMTIAITANGTVFSGVLCNHLDIAPNFAGTLMGITNLMATISSICVPIFIGQLTLNDPTITSWRILFYVTIVSYMIEIVLFSLFASGEEQPWNRPV